MIVITGAAGFIGSCLVGTLNSKGISNLVLVDDFSKTEKDENLEGKDFVLKVERSVFDDWMQENGKKVTVLVELKARFDEANNIKWAKKMKAAGVEIIYSITARAAEQQTILFPKMDKLRA